MVPRQVWLFTVGCWVALATAVFHVIAHVASPRVGSGADSLMSAFPPTYVWAVPGLRQPTFVSVIDGFSLMVAMLLATMGAAGLAVMKHAPPDLAIARAVARVFAVGAAALLAVSIANAFSVETFFFALIVTCFGLCSVRPEEHEHGPVDPHAAAQLPKPTDE